MNLTETMVRMGQLAASDDPGDVLVSLGLGSCIGLAIVDAGRGVAGLAHIMLPTARPAAGRGAGADTAVPTLVEEVLALGARRWALQVALVGGAQMFELAAAEQDGIGARNAAATREALRAVRLPVGAFATGGPTGRTIRVHVGDGRITVRQAGGAEETLLGGSEPTTPTPRR